MGYLDEGDRRQLEEKALFVRLETLRLTRIAGAGHYSGTFSAAELLATLYYHELRLDPANPKWPDRDRFILSKGHAAIGLYPILAELGYFDASELETYTRLGSAFGDHPDMRSSGGARGSEGIRALLVPGRDLHSAHRVRLAEPRPVEAVQGDQ